MGRLTYIFFACVVIFFGYAWTKLSKLDYVYPEIGYTIDELVKSHSYPFEYHSVTTKDGYILELHRIPNQKSKNSKPPILIMHGLTCSSILYLTLGAQSLPYMLSEKGYDVWLGNARGNVYSRKHITLDADVNPKEFFDFSWHEIGSIDLPTMIDYILKQTDNKKLYYAGHSQGSVSFYVMMSELPEYNEKVEVMLALAPVVHTKEIKSWAFNIPAKLQGLLEWLSDAIGYHEILARTDAWTYFGNTFCRDGAWTQPYCPILIGLLGGFNTPGINQTLWPLIYAHTPGGSAAKQLFHYTQILNSDIFRQFDHGPSRNLLKYGQETPPPYYLNRTTAPVAIFWSVNDWLTSERDIALLYKSLPNVVNYYKVPDALFSHFDFLVSFTSQYHLFPEILNVIEEHERKKRKE